MIPGEEARPGALVRPYEPRDRETVRTISYETANGGKSGVSISRDKEFIADILTSYYTDHEPCSTFVAEVNGEVIGYLTGCLDTRRRIRITERRVLPAALLRAVRRGWLFDGASWRLMWSGAKAFLAQGAERGVPLEEYPAHFHMNILNGYRGLGIGTRLMEKFVELASDAGAEGIHLSTREDNQGARGFFEKHGFAVMGRHPTLLAPHGADRPMCSVMYGKRL